MGDSTRRGTASAPPPLDTFRYEGGRARPTRGLRVVASMERRGEVGSAFEI